MQRKPATEGRSDRASRAGVQLTRDALVVRAAGHLDARTRPLLDASFKSACNAARTVVVVDVENVDSCDALNAEVFAAGVRKCIRGGQQVQITAGARTPAALTDLLDATVDSATAS